MERKKKVLAQKERCTNCNHWKTIVLVRFCSMCGEAVNEKIPIMTCSEEEHAIKRHKRNKYCVDCGKQLINSNSFKNTRW